MGARYGKVNAGDVLPHSTTVSRNVAELHASTKAEVMRELRETLCKTGGAKTTDMWTDTYRQISNITQTVHYIDDNWELVERSLTTFEFDAVCKETDENIITGILKALKEFDISGRDLDRIVLVTDRGAYMVAAFKSYTRLSCSSHILNTVLSKTFQQI